MRIFDAETRLLKRFVLSLFFMIAPILIIGAVAAMPVLLVPIGAWGFWLACNKFPKDRVVAHRIETPDRLLEEAPMRNHYDWDGLAALQEKEGHGSNY